MRRATLLAYLVPWLIIGSGTFIVFKQIDASYKKQFDLLEESLLHETIAHFENMVHTRQWNASHGGLFVLQRPGLLPNPYLEENTLACDENRTFIKINPAWMTRQISEIANRKGEHYYKITSLQPLNPDNAPDSFEEEALRYFESNPNETHFSRFEIQQGELTRFDFMGSLKVDEACMACHEKQGYQVGDIRGGIRVSHPLHGFNNARNHLMEKRVYDKLTVGILALLIGIFFTLYLRRSRAHNLLLQTMNAELEAKVDERTRALKELTEHLEERVEKEIAENLHKEKLMLTQSRHAAMGEMIEMLAHQWRQPISVIEMGVNNLLIDLELGSAKDEELVAGLRGISEQTQHLSRTISNITAHFDSDQASQHKPSEILNDVLGIMSSCIQENAIDVTIDVYEERIVSLSKETLFQVYLALLSNAKEVLLERAVAVKQIRVAIGLEAGYVKTEICDNGGGIRATPIEQVFEAYYSTKSAAEGSGLGLYIARLIVEKELGGRVQAANSENGACFTVWLPLPAASDTANAADATEQS